jgi:DNA/RNA-binding domain of Phe-tRNA-synthetase-like protein
MTNQNETQTENHLAVVERETENYVILKDENGKFSRKAKFHDYSSVVAKSREDNIWLLGLYEGDEETGNGLKDHVGKQIVVENIITRKYDRINEGTGQTI